MKTSEAKKEQRKYERAKADCPGVLTHNQIRAVRLDLLARGMLVNEGDRLKTTARIPYPSFGAAASVACGEPTDCSGWRDENGKSVKCTCETAPPEYYTDALIFVRALAIDFYAGMLACCKANASAQIPTFFITETEDALSILKSGTDEEALDVICSDPFFWEGDFGHKDDVDRDEVIRRYKFERSSAALSMMTH